MHWLANAIENFDSSSQHSGWPITGRNKKGVQQNAFLLG